jgi:hypothetical protein
MTKRVLVKCLLVLAGVAAIAGAAATKWSPGGIAWAAAPALLGVAPLALVRSRSREVRYAVIAFATTATLLLASFNVAWLLGLTIGSAGSIPVFVFAPFFSLGAAALVSFVASAVAAVLDYRQYRRSPGS